MGGANGSRECAPDDRLRDTHQLKADGFRKGSTHPANYPTAASDLFAPFGTSISTSSVET